MPNLTLTIGQLRVSPLFWSLCLAFVISSFSLWRRLVKEEYREQDIFATSLFMLLSGLAFGRLSLVTVGAGEIGAFAGAVLIYAWRLKTLGKNVWEGLDALPLPFLYFLVFWGGGLFLTSWKLACLLYSAAGIGGMILYFFLKRRYRRFSWYRSGKTGFLFWALSFYGSVLLLVLDILISGSLYWAKLFWLVMMIASILAIYFRAKE